MKENLLKSVAVVCVYIVSIGVIFASLFLIGRTMSFSDNIPSLSYVYRGILDNTKPVMQYQNETILTPYDHDGVKVLIGFYDMNADPAIQVKTLIHYANTFLPNTGILYSNKEEFEVLATLDGEVEDIKPDEVMGNIVTIKHSNNLRTIYQSLNEVKVQVGDKVKQGDVIGTSGTNKIKPEENYMLLFEVEYNGTYLNPEEFYQMDLKELS